MNTDSNKHQTLHTEDNPEFFGGEMQPYIDDLTKNYEQKLSYTKSPSMTKKPFNKMSKISFWRKFTAFFSFL